MNYEKEITLKDGRKCLLRACGKEDGAEMLAVFLQTHRETDFLRTYPDECTFTEESEGAFLQAAKDSENETELGAFVDGKLVGSAGISAVGNAFKTAHRAEFGISVLKEFWGLGIGRALTEACTELARQAGYLQLELDVLEENRTALALYQSVGFTEFGRNPKGFRSRTAGWQPVILMRLEL